jgi:YcaO cyclodehydratase, ATP-ad Mg2+-binding
MPCPSRLGQTAAAAIAEAGWPDRDGACWYSSLANSGTAAGLNTSEAILHGLLEVIGRDATGIEFIKISFEASAGPGANLRSVHDPERCPKKR